MWYNCLLALAFVVLANQKGKIYMKAIGILGGMSWGSTAFYYQEINKEVNRRLSGLHSGKILLYSVDFENIEALQRQNHFETAGNLLAKHALTLQNAGAEGIVLASNTMHKVADIIADKIDIPFLHIVKPTVQAIKNKNIDHVLLLGTKYSMGEGFLKQYLANARVKVSIPEEEIIEKVDDIIFKELYLGEIKPSSKEEILEIIQNITSRDESINGIILGCTELHLLVEQRDVKQPIFNTAKLHVNDIVDFMLPQVLSPLSIPPNL